MKRLLLICILLTGLDTHLSASNWINPDQPDSLYSGMEWRCIGPYRGGRSTTVCGVIQDNTTFYMGTTGGGVWKTTDGGNNWKNVTDGYLNTGSVGAVAVAPSDPNVIYVGMGEAPIRGVMTSHGDGIYKSTDAGKTWSHLGLTETRQISRIRIHPSNPDIVYVAAQGSPYAPTEQRGVYKSEDGGLSWERVLYVDDQTGVSDLSMDVTNPRVLYAAFWDHQRFPWKIRSGGSGSGIWKSSDSGKTWKELSEGLPDSIMGKIGVAVSPADPQRVYAIIESKQGGLYRSDDGGLSWSHQNKDRILQARSWYYMHIFADPVDPDKLVVLNAPFMMSEDGGKSFTRVQTPHGDNHDLWIHPQNADIMINANDGGANISYNGGKSWSTQQNQPTAQFYRINADHQFPYHVYGGQQDNSTLATPSRWTGGGIPYSQFYRVGGCESAYTAFDPDDPRFVYAGCYQGIITEYDTKLEISKDVMAYTDLGLGKNPKEMKYRFNWNAPIIMSQHDKNVIYHAGNKLLKTSDRGISWEEISPDLTRNDSTKIDFGGGPITNEGAGGENYNTIMYMAESPHKPEVIWVGSDDGLIHITQDGGINWNNVTPPDMKEGMVNCIDLSLHREGKAYVAFTRYKFNDFTPEIYMTSDFGENWTMITNGIADQTPVRCVRADTEREGLLFAGTETGLYISFDDGEQWEKFQLNLPIVPITDMKVHLGDLLVSTQGRAFWILDDITPLRQELSLDRPDLLPIRTAQIWGGRQSENTYNSGTNPKYGALIRYYLKDLDSTDVTLQLMDQQNEVLQYYSTNAKEKGHQLTVQPGINELAWNLERQAVEPVKGLMTFGGHDSPKVGPGSYQARLIVDMDTLTQGFDVLPDPRIEIPETAFKEKHNLLAKLDQTSRDLIAMVKGMRYIQSQTSEALGRDQIKEDSLLNQQGKEIVTAIEKLEKELVQPKQSTFQDVINFSNQLDGELRHIQNIISGSYPPITSGQKARVNDLMEDWNSAQKEWERIQSDLVQPFNQAVLDKSIPLIEIKNFGETKRT